MITFAQLGLAGRLGNALFQFAATYGLAAGTNELPRFNADWIHRPYFCVPDGFFGDTRGGTEAQSLVPHIDPRAQLYLQDVRLFERYLPQLRLYFQPSDMAREMMSHYDHEFAQLPHPILSVHVRRTDKVPGQDEVEDGTYHHCAPIDYYQRAAGLVLAAHDVASIVVFTDEPQWCERELPWADYVHHGVIGAREHTPEFKTAPVLDWIDLQMMAQCDFHVVTGSTFGIWGAMLANSKYVIHPDKVYGPKLDYIDESLLFPSTWHTLEEVATCS